MVELWFSLWINWLKPVSRDTDEYRSEEMMTKSQLPVETKSTWVTNKTPVNSNYSSDNFSSSLPKIDVSNTTNNSNIWYQSQWYQTPSNVDYKIQDIDKKLEQERTNRLLKFDTSIEWVNAPTKLETTLKDTKNIPILEKQKMYTEAVDENIPTWQKMIAWFPKVDTYEKAKTYMDVKSDINKQKDLWNIIEWAIVDIKNWNIQDEATFDKYYPELKDKREAIFWASTDIDNVKNLKQFRELYPELSLKWDNAIDNIYKRVKDIQKVGKKDFVDYAEVVEWYDDMNFWDKAKVIIDPTKKVPWKDIENFTTGLEEAWRFLVNLPPVVTDLTAFAIDTVLNSKKTERMFEQLPSVLKNEITNMNEEVKDKPITEQIMAYWNAIQKFVVENPDIVIDPEILLRWWNIVKNIAKDIDNISSIWKKWLKTVENIEEFKNLVKTEAEVSTTLGNLNEIKNLDINKNMSESINKSIKPTVVAKKGSEAIKDFERATVSSIDTILDNTDAIKYIDEIWEEITKANPETMREFWDAIRQAKEIVYNNYADEAIKAWDVWAKVNTTKIVTELETMKNKLSEMIWQQSSVKYIDEIVSELKTKPELDIKTAQENVKINNNKLQTFYKNPSYADASKTVIDAMVNNILRNELDTSISKALDNGNYKNLKQKYWALSKIEKEVNKRAIVSSRQNTRWLIDFTDFVSADLAVNWMLRIIGWDVAWWVANVARWWVLNTLKNFYKKINSPDYQLQKLIKQVQKAKTEWTLYSKWKSNVAPLTNMNNGLSPIINNNNIMIEKWWLKPIEAENLWKWYKIEWDNIVIEAYKWDRWYKTQSTAWWEWTSFYSNNKDRALWYDTKWNPKKEILTFDKDKVKIIDSEWIKWQQKVDKDWNITKWLSTKWWDNYIDYNNKLAKSEW